MATYTVKHEKHEQDNINFIDINDAKKEMPSFLDYEEVLTYSLENGNITSEANIKSLCDGGDHVPPYFSENTAAYECKMYVENVFSEVQLEFNPGVEEYELY